MKNRLSPLQIHLLELIKENIKQERPETEFLQKKLRRHKNTILYHLKVLKQKGYLDKNGIPTEKSRAGA